MKNLKGYHPELDHGQNRRNRESVVERIKRMCAEQGAKPDQAPSEEFIRKWMMITHAEMNMITLIGQGYPVRNAQAILRAIETKMDRHPTTVKKTSAEANTGVTITVKTEGGAPTASVSLPEELEPEEKH